MRSRELARASERAADQNSDRLRDALAVVGGRSFIATVSAVQPGAASDGNALVTVTWKGGPTTAAGYDANYAPAVGHRVLCVLADDQLIVQLRIVGYP